MALVLDVGERDRRIIVLARSKLFGSRCDFERAIRALCEALEELIPAGRVFVLGAGERGPIVGSLVSGVGIADTASGVQLVRVYRNTRLALGHLTERRGPLALHSDLARPAVGHER